MLIPDEILFIETSNEGDTYFFTENKKLYYVNYIYGKEFTEKDIYELIPDFRKASCKNPKKFNGINLGLGHALLIRTSIFDSYMKILTNETLYENQYEHCYNAYNHWMNSAIKFLDGDSCEKGKIILYNRNGTISNEKQLNSENLKSTAGMISKCHMKDGTIKIGYSDPTKVETLKQEEWEDKVHDTMNLWQWDNLDEEKHDFFNGKVGAKIEKVIVNDIEYMECILYSHWRWGGHLTNKFEFSKPSIK